MRQREIQRNVRGNEEVILTSNKRWQKKTFPLVPEIRRKM